jgi:hypothetical protein
MGACSGLILLDATHTGRFIHASGCGLLDAATPSGAEFRQFSRVQPDSAARGTRIQHNRFRVGTVHAKQFGLIARAAASDLITQCVLMVRLKPSA